jgi:hypothetical protein
MNLQRLQNAGLRLRVEVWRLGPARCAAWVVSGMAIVVGVTWFGALAPKYQRDQDAALQAAIALQARPAKPADRAPVTDQVVAISAALAAPDQVGIVLRDLFTAAEKAELELEQADYKWIAEPSAASRRLQINLPVKGSYSAIRALCEHLLLAQPALSLDDFALRRESVADEAAVANLQFTLYLRSESGTTSAVGSASSTSITQAEPTR